MSFTKRVEDFTCARCSRDVKGTGFTNHCPGCLWSMHVDVEPGDRAAACGGLMKPISIRVERDAYRVYHRCETCGKEMSCKTSADDDFEMILRVSKADPNR